MLLPKESKHCSQKNKKLLSGHWIETNLCDTCYL